jgi:hypothetical protein
MSRSLKNKITCKNIFEWKQAIIAVARSTKWDQLDPCIEQTSTWAMELHHPVAIYRLTTTDAVNGIEELGSALDKFWKRDLSDTRQIRIHTVAHAKGIAKHFMPPVVTSVKGSAQL